MITLIGLGAGDVETLSRGAERALRQASQDMAAGTGVLFLRTEIHPVVATLREWGLDWQAFDGLYTQGRSFEVVYAAMTARVLDAASRETADGQPFSVAFAVPGHPLFAEDAARQILDAAHAQNIPTQIIGSGSFVEACLTAVGASLGAGCQVLDALALPLVESVDAQGFPTGGSLDTSRALLLYQVYDQASASQAKLALMRVYPDDWKIALVTAAGVAGEETVRRVPLFRLDREPVNHLTSVYVPPLPPDRRALDFTALVGIMARLRAPDGCPWDREQTHASLRKYLIEETYEAIEAIDAGDADLLCEELGDVLLQVVFHAQLANEEGVFTVRDVAARISEKLIRRHPHVFGTAQVAGSDDVLRNWEQIKRAEKTQHDPDWRKSALDGVPIGLPALLRALEISKRAVKVGFEWESLPDVVAKLDEEIAELKVELNAPTLDRDRLFSELGDVLFTVVQIARWHKLDPEDALRAMLRRFEGRFRWMESTAQSHEQSLSDLPLPELDALWNQAKLALAKEN